MINIESEANESGLRSKRNSLFIISIQREKEKNEN